MTGIVSIALLMFWQADPGQARFEQAQQLAAQGRCAEAVPVFQQLASAHPGIAAIPFALGQCEFSQKNYLAAVDSFARVLQLQPDQAGVRVMYGSALGLAGRTPEAIEQLRQATRQDQSLAAGFRLLGMFEVENGQTSPEAQAALERAVVLDGSDARAHYWLGQLHFLNKDYETALQEFAASLAAAREAAGHLDDVRDRRSALWLLSRLYRATGDAEQARENERQLNALEQGMNDDLARFRTLQEQAMRYRSAGDFAKVASTLEQALHIERRQDSLVMLGDAYRALHRPKDAEQADIVRRLEQIRAGREEGAK